MAQDSIWDAGPAWAQMTKMLNYWKTVSSGIPGFFAPNPLAFWGPQIPLGTDHTGYYSTAPLARTLGELVDFSLLNRGQPRFTVGAAHVRTSRMCYFDSRDMKIDVAHIMASGALPPAFPPVRIDGELYWDGGILSNTPTEIAFDDNPRRSCLMFAVHMWHPNGAEPQTMGEVAHRQKDIQYSSRVATHVARQMQIHRLRHIITELVGHIPEAARKSDAVRTLAGYGCLTRMHVVRLLAPRLDHEDQTKDVDFSPSGIRARWEAGHADTLRAIEAAPWRGEFDPLDGVILHEPAEGIRLEPAANGPAAPAGRGNGVKPRGARPTKQQTRNGHAPRRNGASVDRAATT